LSQNKDFINSAKLYKVMSDEYKKQICGYIIGISMGLGLNIEKILEKQKL